LLRKIVFKYFERICKQLMFDLMGGKDV